MPRPVGGSGRKYGVLSADYGWSSAILARHQPVYSPPNMHLTKLGYANVWPAPWNLDL